MSDVKQTVKWLIEGFSADNGTLELANAVKELGYELSLNGVSNPRDLIEKYPLLKDELKRCDDWTPFGDYQKYFPKHSCVVPCTSIQAASQIIKQCPTWIPSVWDNAELFHCKYYYQFFGDLLFNDRYMMLPAGEVLRRLDDLYAWLGKHDTIFIRPSTGRKTFTGQLFDRKTFEYDWNAVMGYGGSPIDLVVVSTPKIILGEYRYVIGRNEIIASSQYSWDGKPTPKPSIPKIDEYVKHVLKTVDYEPDPVWIMDIATDTDENPHVLEVGSFSCSGLYACDMKKIVDKVSQIAYDEYQEFKPI